MRTMVFLILAFSFPSLVWADFTPGHIFVANTPSSRSAGNDFIDEYTPDGVNLGRFIGPEQGIRGLRDLAYDPATGHLLYTVNVYFNPERHIYEIREVDASGQLIRTYDHEDFGSGNIELVFGPDNTLYAANHGHVYRRFPGETTLTKFCTLPINPLTRFPVGVGDLEIDPQGNLLLSDPFVNYNVYRIYPDGRVEIFADRNDGLNEPYGIAMDGSGNLFASNVHGSNHALVKIDPLGQGQEFVPHGILRWGAHDLAFDASNYLLAACRNHHRIFRFAPSGTYELFAGPGDGMSDPAAIVQIPYPCRTDFDDDLDTDGSDLALFVRSFAPGCLDAFGAAYGTN